MRCVDFTRIAASKFQTQHAMTSLIRSHTKYLVQTYHILMFIL